MAVYQKILESKTKVRFHDCDPYNHLNNSRYIDYILMARGDQLVEAYGFDIYELVRREGVGWVSAQTQISYFAPAFLMEEVTIQTRLIGCSEKSLHLEGIVWNGEKTVVKALMWTKLVHFNLRTQKSQHHSEALMDLFRQVVYPFDQLTGFEDRINILKHPI